jgi:aminocarboxymuconate-semialdehyde decarboxylase
MRNPSRRGWGFRFEEIVADAGGTALSHVIGRLPRNYSLEKDNLGGPDAVLPTMYHDIIIQDTRALRCLASIIGADRICRFHR